MDGLFRWVVSGLLAVLAALLSVIAAMVVWIFLSLTRRVDELEDEVAKLKTRLRLQESGSARR